MKTALVILILAAISACQPTSADMSEFELITQKGRNIIYNSPPSDAKIHLYETCEAAGAKVTFFHNGCANYCSAVEMPTMPICTTAITKACLCPESQCYDKDRNICRMPRALRPTQ
ncbi:MAG: hypothetical protein HOM96_01675 [Rickettsiales bacterium]|jgi:hypothetical protein|nr:hypothetical protein [Rickettsiales bacterium]